MISGTSIRKLYIIGNGFDLHHGARSSYNDFRDYLFKVDRDLAESLKFFIDSSNLWGDFENNLAELSREKLMAVVEDFILQCEPYEEDFRVADFELGIAQATGMLYRFTEDLQFHFYKWLRQVYLPKGHKKRKLKLDTTAFFMNFNYTPFLEMLYDVSKEQILYLHGSTKGNPKSIVLGHGKNDMANVEKWKIKKTNEIKMAFKKKQEDGICLSKLGYLAWFATEEEYWQNVTETEHWVLERVVPEIENYFERSYKNVEDIIRSYNNTFERLKTLKEIDIIGHSLSTIDYAYFRHLININTRPNKIKWSISYHKENDQDQIKKFTEQLDIGQNQIEIYKLGEKLLVPYSL